MATSSLSIRIVLVLSAAIVRSTLHSAGAIGESTADQHLRIQNILAAMDRREADRSWIAPFVVRTYGPVVAGLPLTSDDQSHVLRLLAQRIGAVADERSAFARKNRESLRAGSGPVISSKEEREAAQASAAAESESEMKSLLGPTIFETVKQMIAEQSELSTIESGHGKSLSKSGTPLTAQQRLSLAHVLHRLNEDRGAWILSKRTGEQPLKSSGMTGDEEESLARMKDFLSAPQIEYFRRSFIFTERAIHGIPLVWERSCDVPDDAAHQIAVMAGENGPRFGQIRIFLRGAGKAMLVAGDGNTDRREFCAVQFDSHPSDKNGMGLLMTASGVALFYDQQLVRIVGENQVAWVGNAPAAKL